MKEHCQCEAFCYTYHTGAWQHRVALLGNVFTTAMATVLSQSHGIPVDSIVNNGAISLKSLKFDRTKNNVEMTARGLAGGKYRLPINSDSFCVSYFYSYCRIEYIFPEYISCKFNVYQFIDYKYLTNIYAYTPTFIQKQRRFL